MQSIQKHLHEVPQSLLRQWARVGEALLPLVLHDRHHGDDDAEKPGLGFGKEIERERERKILSVECVGANEGWKRG